jgi:hypothetical protein
LSGICSLLFAAVRACAGQRQRYILVLSQMRSGSTLLHHLLQTNPNILGAGETPRIYASVLDLQRLSLRVHVDNRSLPRWKLYAADQINLTSRVQAESLLLRPDVQIVFLIREPRGVIGSAVSKIANRYHWTFQQAVDYYFERTASLRRLIAEIGQMHQKQAFGLTYDMLTDDTTGTLAALQRHLALADPFQTNYRTYFHTGKRGDPSDRIRAGTVLEPNRHDRLILDPALEDALNRQYELTLTAMQHNCATPPARVAA